VRAAGAFFAVRVCFFMRWNFVPTPSICQLPGPVALMNCHKHKEVR
jgi:hypothetical protein